MRAVECRAAASMQRACRVGGCRRRVRLRQADGRIRGRGRASFTSAQVSWSSAKVRSSMAEIEDQFRRSSCSSRSIATAPSRSTASSSGRSAARSATAAWPPARPLPSTRALAGQLGVSRGIVVEAYEQLVAEGYLASRPGGATRVARGGRARPSPPRRRTSTPRRSTYDFRPGRPDVSRVPARGLAPLAAAGPQRGAERSARRTSTAAASRSCATALAAYLNRVRGTAADPADIVDLRPASPRASASSSGRSATRGARRDRRRGPVRPGVPGDDPRAPGSTRSAIPVDDAGLRVDVLAAADADAVLVTAGPPVPDRRRAAARPPGRARGVGRRARRRRSSRTTTTPSTATTASRSGRSRASARTTSSTPARRARSSRPGCGWAGSSSRRDLVEPSTIAKQAADNGLRRLRPARVRRPPRPRRARPSPPPDAADLPRAGATRCSAALARHLPELRPAGASAGLHVLAWLPPTLDEAALIDAAAAEPGSRCPGLTPRRIAPGPGGLIFGYGPFRRTRIDDGIRRLAAVVADGRVGERTSASPQAQRRRGRPSDRSSPSTAPSAGASGTTRSWARRPSRHRHHPRRHPRHAGQSTTGRTAIRRSSRGRARSSSRSIGCPTPDAWSGSTCSRRSTRTTRRVGVRPSRRADPTGRSGGVGVSVRGEPGRSVRGSPAATGSIAAATNLSSIDRDRRVP